MTTVDQASAEERQAALSANAYAITVSFELEEGSTEKFQRLVSENARQSIALEPGCLRFDVLFPTNGAIGREVFLYEIYTDQAAFDVHLASPHFKSFDEETRTLVRKKTVNAFTAEPVSLALPAGLTKISLLLPDARWFPAQIGRLDLPPWRTALLSA